jgi:signal transduction histidine kinase
LAILSHDLRNPLNSIAMSASLLPHLVQPATEAVDVASQIATNAEVMARMISDLLDYTRTRLGAGMPVSPAPMDLGMLCQELHNEFRSAHPNRKIELRSEGDLTGRWDADRLRQAISNLLGNAIQHSPEARRSSCDLAENRSDVVLAVSTEAHPFRRVNCRRFSIRSCAAQVPNTRRSTVQEALAWACTLRVK